MNTQTLRPRLLALKAQIDSLLVELDASGATGENVLLPSAQCSIDNEPCQHPKAHRQDLNGFGAPDPDKWRCGKCGHYNKGR